MTTPVVACLKCKHYAGNARCTAFPKGIPNAILTGRNLHQTPVRGDHGIMYEPRTPQDPPRDPTLTP